jgi:site-specific DNA recombinase
VYQGVHEPLVTRVVWERCQEILDGRHEKKHRKVKHDFVFSGLVNCGHCGCSLVGEIKKARYVYYHCTGYRGKCPEPYTREEILENQFAGGLHGLVIPPAVLTWLQREIVADDLKERQAREQATRRHEAELDRLEGRLDILYEDRLDGRIDADTYDRRAQEIRAERCRVQARITECRSAILPPAAHALDLMSLTSRAAELFQEQTGSEKRRLLRVVVAKATWQTGELRMCFREPFEKMRLSNSVSATNNGHFTGDGPVLDIWRATMDTFRTFLADEAGPLIGSNRGGRFDFSEL